MLQIALRLALWVFAIGLATSGSAQESSKPRLILIGDSTVKNGSGRGDSGLWGWGQVIDKHFDTSRIDIENHAIGGRSSRTFLTEGRWDRALERLRPGDFVIMQFGHNDGGDKFKGDRPRASIKGNGDETQEGVVEATGKSETVHSYGWYLRKYISDTKSKGATAIVCSLVPRDRWQDGKVIRSNQDYGQWAAEAAKDAGAWIVDLNEIVARRYEEIGEEEVGAELFTEKDWTHTTKAGAEVTAACLAEAIRQLEGCSFTDYLQPSKVRTGRQSTLRFAFGDEVAPGFTRVNTTDVYSAERGYGFEQGSRIAATALGCTGEGAFYFSTALPEGNYRVLMTLDAADETRHATIKAELRRLMLRDDLVLPDSGTIYAFTVNVRTPHLPNGEHVRLKTREKEQEMWAWDDKLTLEINGSGVYLSLLTIKPEPEAVTVFLAGDSTVTDQPHEPWASWGQMLPEFFLPGVAIANHAQSGESIQSSLDAKRFDKIFSLIKPGDYLIMQFGHNDMKNTSPDALATYRTNLKRLIERTRELGAHPVLVTSMERKASIDSPTLKHYPETVRDVARELDVPLIDLNAISLVLYEALGENLDHAFQDGTHHTNYGSYLLAKCVVQSIRDLKLPLAEQIVDEFTGFDPRQPDTFDSVHIPASPLANFTQPAGS
jgi:lysophospholipase L1-like esterase